MGDRGMLTTSCIREDLKEEEGLDWISALRSDGIRKLIANVLAPPLSSNLERANSVSPLFLRIPQHCHLLPSVDCVNMFIIQNSFVGSHKV